MSLHVGYDCEKVTHGWGCHKLMWECDSQGEALQGVM